MYFRAQKKLQGEVSLSDSIDTDKEGNALELMDVVGEDTDLFEQIFSHILSECYKYKFVDPTEVFVDATHVKACANSKKMRARIAREEILFYEELLKKEINSDR